MTIYKYSTLANDAIVNFKPLTDTLIFDVTNNVVAINAADLSITESGAHLIFTDSVNFKLFTLQNTALAQLSSSKITFSTGSKLIVGDNTTGIKADNSTNVLTGGVKADLLYGMGGNDKLVGGLGADVLIGGNDNDTYIVDNVNDQVNENDPNSLVGGIDSVQSNVSYILNTNVENLRLFIGTKNSFTNINGTGNTLNNTVVGNNGNNTLQGLEGDDRISGNKGNDTLDGGTGNDILIGDNGNDLYYVDSAGDKVIETSALGGTDTVVSTISYTLDVHIENLTLTGDLNSNTTATGNKLSNILIGNDGANVLDGVVGADIFDGGKGNDIYIINSKDDLITESAVALNQLDLLSIQQIKFGYSAAGFTDIDLVKASLSYTLPDNLEELKLVGASNINAKGNALNNIFYANVGNNIFNGVSGNDTVSYQPNQPEIPVNATLIIESAALAGVTASLANTAAQFTKGSGTDTFSNIDNLVGSQYNDNLTGNSVANILDGGAGADILTGGNDNDTYIVDSGDVVIETNASVTQIDTVLSSADYILPKNVERLTLIGPALSNGVGNNLSNIIIGNLQANTLDGLGGADRLEGQGGDDRYIVDSFDTVIEVAGGGTDTIVAANLSISPLAPNVENLQLIGSISLTGKGNELINTIYANTGNSNLNGGVNLAGVDTVSYEFGANSGVMLDMTKITAQDTGGSGFDVLVGFGNVTASRYNDMIITPDGGFNIINGLNGSDTVSYAKDTNWISANFTTGTVNEYNASGSQISSDSLISIENIIGTSKNDNFIIASPADNKINGGSGVDTVSYETSTTGVAVNLAIIGEQTPAPSYYLGYDTLISIENLTGSSFADKLIGNTGNNTLVGGIGADVLIGGTGVDVFKLTTVSDSLPSSLTDLRLGIDVIKDFNHAQGDLIDLALLLPDTSGVKEFNFISTDSFSSTEGQAELRYSKTTPGDKMTMLYGDVGGDGIADFAIQLTGEINPVKADFIL